MKYNNKGENVIMNEIINRIIINDSGFLRRFVICIIKGIHCRKR